MHSRLPSASLIQSNARHHHHHHHHVPWHEQTKYHGSSTSANAPSPAVFTFAPLPQLGTQSPLDVSTVALCTMELTSSFMWVPSLSLNDHPPMASYGGDPPHLHSLATLQTSVPNLQRGSSSMSASWRTNACKHPLLYGFTQLALCAKFLQAVFTQDGDQDKNHISSKGLPLLEVQKQRLLFCSIGLAGREVRDVEKLNISQAESSLVSDNSSNEKGSNSVDIQSLSSGEATRNLNESDTEKGKKVAAGDRAYNTVKHLSAGAISAMVSRTFVAPLERLKLEYMVRGAQQNVLQIIRLIVASEGVGGFWKGNVVNLLRTAPFKSVNFFCYDVYRKRLLEITGREEATNFERLVAGGAAGISATLLCFPMDTIRTKMVAPGGEALGGVIGCFQHMLRTEGFFSLYKGLLPAVISMAPSGAVFYGVYDILKTSYLQSPEGQEDLRKRIEMEKRRRRSERKVQGDVLEEGFATKVQANLKEEAGKLGQLELGPVRTLVYGAIAGICAEMATYPFEVVRRQLQMQNAATKMGALATCRGLMQRGGVGAFYSGLLPSALQVLPSASISYFVYECMKIFLEVS